MGLKKYRADKLFDGYRFLDDDSVLITDDEGVVEAIVPFAEAGEDVQSFRGILSPGLINCHCHLELSHMKGHIPKGTGLAEFVLTVVQQRHYPEEEIMQAIEKAEDEMLKNGIVAAGDICNNALCIMQKNKGRIYYHNFIEASGYHPSVADQRFERSLEFFKAYSQLYSIPVESNSIVPHAPYSVSNELWEKIIHFPGNHLFTIHNQETEAEDSWFLNKQGNFTGLYQKMNIDVSFFQPTGKRSLQSYLSRFLKNQFVILVHNVHTTEQDIEYSKSSVINSKLFWCFCPNANLYISDRLPSIDLFMRHNCDIVLGTDSLASNDELSILSEIKTIQKSFPNIDTAILLKWATSNGARALQMDSQLGSFEKGKRPGIISIDDNFTSLKRLA